MPTSPSFTPRGSQDGSEGIGALSPQYEVTAPSFSPRGSLKSPPSQPAAAEQPPIFADKAAKNCLWPGSTQQRAGRSAFCFGRPAMAQAPPAVDAQDAASHSTQPSSSSQVAAEQTDQSLAAGCGTSAESTAQQATAHCRRCPLRGGLQVAAGRLKRNRLHCQRASRHRLCKQMLKRNRLYCQRACRHRLRPCRQMACPQAPPRLTAASLPLSHRPRALQPARSPTPLAVSKLGASSQTMSLAGHHPGAQFADAGRQVVPGEQPKLPTSIKHRRL